MRFYKKVTAMQKIAADFKIFISLTLRFNRERAKIGGPNGFCHKLIFDFPDFLLVSEWPESGESYCYGCRVLIGDYNRLKKLIEDEYSDTICIDEDFFESNMEIFKHQPKLYLGDLS